MKIIIKISTLAMFFLLLFSGCKDDINTPPEDAAFATLKAYLQDNNMDLTDILNDWIVDATTVHDNPGSFYVMDIRSEDDYNIGHIPGAVKSTLGTIVADAAAADNPIVVVCYTGQTAGHAVVALRLSGFSDARVLMFGMASWHADFAGPWNSNIGDVGVGHTNWSTDVSEPTPETYAYPEINTTATDGAAILAERVAVLTAGFNGIENTTVLDNPGDYFINNYWGIDDWEHYGHIEGAYRLNPLSLENINHVNPERTIVTYCYTGQTSSMITAYLKVLGYDALSLLFGTNGMIHSVMESHQWTTETPAGFEVE